MSKKINHVSNPLTVIAIFAGIAETSGTLILPFLGVSLQWTYIWFLMAFPTILLFIFFYVLWKKPGILYAPSDYNSDEAFLGAIDKRIEIKAANKYVEQEVKKISEKIDEVDERTKKEMEVYALVYNILYLKEGLQQVSQTELNNIIEKVSEWMKERIFELANGARFLNWERNKPIMERTIPIFRALIASDSEKTHFYYGALGFTLKDKQKPEWKEAYKYLTEAIESRGEWNPRFNRTSLLYEVNRGICKINLDKEFNNNKPSTSEVREEIIKDISTLQKSKDVHYFRDNSLCKWMNLNKVKLENLCE
jgi:hypothetical protein